jgi:hypothetical protein
VTIFSGELPAIPIAAKQSLSRDDLSGEFPAIPIALKPSLSLTIFLANFRQSHRSETVSFTDDLSGEFLAIAWVGSGSGFLTMFSPIRAVQRPSLRSSE